jgi:4-hydroxy-tetrahydrodipicolinate reductase
MRLAIVGASGKMGRSVVRAAVSENIGIVCAIGVSDVGRDVGELSGVGHLGIPISDTVDILGTAGASVVIDFSSPVATTALAPVAAAARVAIVTGTTGLGDDARKALDRASVLVPTLVEPNLSIGVHVLATLLARAVAALPDWDVEIVEMHHRSKMDAPSGTALRLGRIAEAARVLPTRLVHGRDANHGVRKPEEVGVHALRAGDIVGEHVVHLVGTGERIELVHRATSRDVFAHGAIRAARWITGKPPGSYGLQDVLGWKGDRPS